MTNCEIRTRLIGLADEQTKSFNEKLTPGESQMLGVRIPLVRELAKEIDKGDWDEYLKNPSLEFHEERLLYGFVIGYVKVDLEIVLEHFDKWLECVNNWAVCDCGVSTMKVFGKKQNAKRVWQYLTEKLETTQEPYIKRALIFAMFRYFNSDEYVRSVAKIFEGIHDEHYYVKMVLAWGIADIAVNHLDVVIEMFRSGKLGRWVQNKAIQKSCESFRLSHEQKTEMRAFKKIE